MTISNVLLDLFTDASIESDLGNMAANVALQNFDYRYATLCVFNSTLFLAVEIFLRVFNYNVIINRDRLSQELIRITRQYVIFGNDIMDLEQLLETLHELEMENTGKFIIVCQSRDLIDCDEKYITKLFGYYNIVNIVFVKSQAKEAVGYTYFPISNGSCHNVDPIRLQSSNSSQHLTSVQGNAFGMKLKTLSFCPLHVTTFIQIPYMNITKSGTPIGADGDLLRIIAYGLNTSLKMRTPHRGEGWGYRLKNMTWMGSLGDLQADLANMSMTSPALALTRFSDFQVSSTYQMVYVVWITHPATVQNEALKLIYPFHQDTRIALIVSYVIVILCAFVAKTHKFSSVLGESENDQSSRSVVFYSWMICMGQSLIKLPTKSGLLQMTYLWIYYCFIIRTVYQVYLISSLKGKFYEDQFQSIEDAIEANYPFGGGVALQDYYIDNPEVYNNWIHVDATDILPTLLNMSRGKKFVLAMNWDTAKMVIKKHKISLHVLPKRIISSPTGILFKKYSPLAESINIILSRLITAGFPDKLHKNYTSFNVKHNDDEQETLKIVHLTACYVILILGWLISAVFFLLELYFGKIYKHPII